MLPWIISFSGFSPARLETVEKLEQLRVLENGYKIKVVETQSATISVDYPADIAKVESALMENEHD